jgi:hypothetical protein
MASWLCMTNHCGHSSNNPRRHYFKLYADIGSCEGGWTATFLLSVLWQSGIGWLPYRPIKQPFLEHPMVTTLSTTPSHSGVSLSSLTDSRRTFRIKSLSLWQANCGFDYDSSSTPSNTSWHRYNQYLLILCHCCSRGFQTRFTGPSAKVHSCERLET